MVVLSSASDSVICQGVMVRGGGWSWSDVVPCCRLEEGSSMVSVLDVLTLQVLGNNTVCLQCAKLKYVKLSGGTNRAGASEQQAETGVCPRHQRLCCPASHHQLSTNEYFAKKIANMFLLRCRLLMF